MTTSSYISSILTRTLQEDIINNNNNNTNTTNEENTTLAFFDQDEAVEKEHESDAFAALALNFALIGCVLLAYYVKKYKVYYMPESAAAMIVGVIIGGLARLSLTNLTLFTFSPELFFFVLLPPIIFEAGYSLDKKNFFENIGAITLYAIIGTMISTFIVGYLTFLLGRNGIITNIDPKNPMESLLFGALISAVDPVATLAIMGSPELQCDQLLYSLVFGESVLNDAVAIVLFRTFRKYYDPDAPDFSHSDVPEALLAFFVMTFASILVGVGMGLLTSFIYKQTDLREFPKLETALLFLFCYCCFATAEAVGLSGIMALFFNGIVLSHYNSYNLSRTAHVTSEQIFATLAVVTETIVFLYMGMGVFTGKFAHWDILFSVLAFLFCILGRAANIFPLSWLANCCRRRNHNRIPFKMQFVLWFAGLRGAIAFALAENMPGPNRSTYATATLTICFFTTIVCGGFTEPMLSRMGMKQGNAGSRGGYDGAEDDDDDDGSGGYDQLIGNSQVVRRMSKTVYAGARGVWRKLDNKYLKEMFGGSKQRQGRVMSARDSDDEEDGLGNYELSVHVDSDDEDERDEANFINGDDGHGRELASASISNGIPSAPSKGTTTSKKE